MELRYNAIVLRKKEVGETDRLYTLYTESAGKLQLVAKGVRKPEAKLAGQLETLMQGLVIVVKGRGAGKIAGAVAEKSYLHVRHDLDTLKRVLEATSIFERLVGWEEKDLVLFELLSKYLEIVNTLAQEKKTDKVLLVTEGFLFQLFAHLLFPVWVISEPSSSIRIRRRGRAILRVILQVVWHLAGYRRVLPVNAAHHWGNRAADHKIR